MAATTKDWLAAAGALAEQRTQALADRLGAAFLHATEHGRYMTVSADWWTSGFWPGMLLLAYQRTGESHYLELAEAAEAELERAITDERFYGLHHDVGFQFVPTAVGRYRLTGDVDARRRGLLAAFLLMSRFNPASGVIEAWNGAERRGFAIIDTLMNLPLLFWAAKEMDQPRFRNVAEAHLRVALAEFVRDDGSTAHIVRFDPVTGVPIARLAGQGYTPDSCWSRGQAWALYGLTLAARATGQADYLAAARRVADAFLAALPPALVPPWDFRAPETEQAPRDSSAGAIAGAGLLHLAQQLSDTGTDYHDAAVRLLRALFERCAADEHADQEGLLRHATGNLPAGRDIDVSLIYGDYFFLEALGTLDGRSVAPW